MRLFLTALFVLGLCLNGLAQKSSSIAYPFSGYVRDSVSGEPISGANVFVTETRKGVATGKDGYFIIPLTPGNYVIKITHLGFRPQVFRIRVQGSVLREVRLQSNAEDLAELTVSTQAADRNVQKAEIGVSQLNIKTIKRIPAFMGEVDVVRSLLLLPGVTTVGEGAPGFNVRGGNTDQNLMLLDDAPVLNPSHLMGLFSAFNPDVVRDVTLHRSGISPSYGGRVSSVLDVRVKEPETQRWTFSGGIGLISSRLTAEGPVIKNKLSTLVAARGSISDYLFALGPKSLRGTKANFFDLTTKWKYQLNEQHTLTYTGYFSNDGFKLASDSLASVEVNASSTRYNYQTLNHTLRWNYFVSNRLNIATSAIWSQYRPETSVPDPSNAFRLKSAVEQRQLKADATFTPSETHTFGAGVSLIDYHLNPNSLIPGPVSNVLPIYLPVEKAYEPAVFVQDEWKLSEVLLVTGGLRYSTLWNRGPVEIRSYAENLPREPESVSSVRTVESGRIYHRAGGLEPRLALRLLVGEGNSIKAGYNRMRQYLQQVTNTMAALPISRWKLSDTHVRPQVVDQWSVGFFRNTKDNALELSAEVYYKTLQNAIDYKDGADLLLNKFPETEILQGSGQSYGLETQIRKNKGYLTGWISYTYSRTFLTINGPSVSEKVNNGLAYPANFDKPHSMNATMVYRPNVRFSLSANFTYSTGRPVTQPYAKAWIKGVQVPIYINRNQERIPDYHRLDISMQFDPDPAKKRKLQGSWIFAIYNVYARRNAYSAFFRLSPASLTDAYKLAVFGTAFPSLTYNFKF